MIVQNQNTDTTTPTRRPIDPRLVLAAIAVPMGILIGCLVPTYVEHGQEFIRAVAIISMGFTVIATIALCSVIAMEYSEDRNPRTIRNHPDHHRLHGLSI